MTMSTYKFSTGINVLDKMLGLSNEKKGGKTYNKIVLIKGGPGSGKTTMGLQIINNHLKTEKFIAGYVSLEIEPDVSCGYVAENFLFKEFRKNSDRFFKTSKEELIRSLRDYYNPETSHPPKLSDVIFSCLKNEEDENLKNDDAYKIIFFDSLNVLIDIIHSVVDKKMDDREIIKSICDINRSTEQEGVRDKNTIFLFSVEYHPAEGQTRMAISESFMCDTEILLSVEPIFTTVDKALPNISSIGYKMEGDLEGKKKNEYRSFCRVLKTRFDNHQTRRCAYDIKNEEGIHFYESFPGDGQVTLFNENEQQIEAWDSFFREDIPHQFPALRHETFDSKRSQQNFSSRRRFRYVPEKTDLFLSSFDNYWIHWFTNIERKTEIKDFLKEESKTFKGCFKSEESMQNVLPTLTNKLNDFFLREIIDFKKIKETLIENSKENFSVRTKLESLNHFLIIEANCNQLKVSLEPYEEKDLKLVKPDGRFIDIKNTCINHATQILFTTSHLGGIRRNVIDLGAPDDVFMAIILRNSEGMVIPVLKKTTSIGNLPNWCIDRIVFTNYFHQKIEFSTSDNNETLIYDSRYNTTNKSKRSYPLLPAQLYWPAIDFGNNTSIYIDNEKITQIAITSNAIANRLVLNLKLNSIQNNPFPVLNSFKLIEIDESTEKIINVLSSKNVLNCVSCLCLNNIHFSELNLNPDGKEFNRNFSTNRRDLNCPYRDDLNANINGGSRFIKCLWYREILNKIDFEKSNVFTLDTLYKLNSILEEHFAKKVFDAKKIKEIFNEYMEKLEVKNSQYLSEDIQNLYIKLLNYSEQKSFLATIDKNGLKLFGDRQSGFIKEFNQLDFKNNRPIHYKQSLFGFFDNSSYLSIPYNANIGIFVYRKDILNEFYEDIKNKVSLRNDYIQLVEKIYWRIEEKLEVLTTKEGKKKSDEEIEKSRKDKKEQIEGLITLSSLNLYPQTWEEIFGIYLLKHQKKEFIMDIKSSDTYNCIFLELLWNSGGDFNVKPDYSFDREKNKKFLLQAYYLFSYLYYSNIADITCSFQPDEFAKTYNDASKRDWIFGRFWYSSFVELLNAKKKPKNEDINGPAENIWNPIIKNELSLMPMPVTIDKYIGTNNPNNVEHCSAWGDWHLGIIKGSENMKLGEDIINHLMSSRKITENAYSNAILPTTYDFYKLYKNSRCFNPNSNKSKNIVIPTTTYKEIQYKYFRHAQSRSQVYDIRHCMLELNTILKFIENAVMSNKPSSGDMPEELPMYLLREINHLLDHSLDAIERLIKLDQ